MKRRTYRWLIVFLFVIFAVYIIVFVGVIWNIEGQHVSHSHFLSTQLQTATAVNDDQPLIVNSTVSVCDLYIANLHHVDLISKISKLSILWDSIFYNTFTLNALYNDLILTKRQVSQLESTKLNDKLNPKYNITSIDSLQNCYKLTIDTLGSMVSNTFPKIEKNTKNKKNIDNLYRAKYFFTIAKEKYENKQKIIKMRREIMIITVYLQSIMQEEPERETEKHKKEKKEEDEMGTVPEDNKLYHQLLSIFADVYTQYSIMLPKLSYFLIHTPKTMGTSICHTANELGLITRALSQNCNIYRGSIPSESFNWPPSCETIYTNLKPLSKLRLSNYDFLSTESPLHFDNKTYTPKLCNFLDYIFIVRDPIEKIFSYFHEISKIAYKGFEPIFYVKDERHNNNNNKIKYSGNMNDNDYIANYRPIDNNKDYQGLISLLFENEPIASRNEKFSIQTEYNENNNNLTQTDSSQYTQTISTMRLFWIGNKNNSKYFLRQKFQHKIPKKKKKYAENHLYKESGDKYNSKKKQKQNKDSANFAKKFAIAEEKIEARIDDDRLIKRNRNRNRNRKKNKNNNSERHLLTDSKSKIEENFKEKHISNVMAKYGKQYQIKIFPTPKPTVSPYWKKLLKIKEFRSVASNDYTRWLGYNYSSEFEYNNIESNKPMLSINSASYIIDNKHFENAINLMFNIEYIIPMSSKLMLNFLFQRFKNMAIKIDEIKKSNLAKLKEIQKRNFEKINNTYKDVDMDNLKNIALNMSRKTNIRLSDQGIKLNHNIENITTWIRLNVAKDVNHTTKGIMSTITDKEWEIIKYKNQFDIKLYKLSQWIAQVDLNFYSLDNFNISILDNHLTRQRVPTINVNSTKRKEKEKEKVL